jgi:hypothetical protein
MTQIHFHCSKNGRALERLAVAVEDLAEARDHAARIAHSLMMKPGPEDWRSWTLHVCDDLGDELFIVPFAFALGKAH